LRNARQLRQALIVATDRTEQHSRLSIEQLLGVVQSASGQVYVIGDFSADDRDVFQARTPTVNSGWRAGNRQSHPGIRAPGPRIRRGVLLPHDACAIEMRHRRRGQGTRYAIHAQLLSGVLGRGVTAHSSEVAGRGLKAQTRRGFSTADDGVPFTTDACAPSAEQHWFPYESKLTHKPEHLIGHEDFTDPRSGWPFGDTSWRGYGVTGGGSIREAHCQNLRHTTKPRSVAGF
jgi:hypothetical protein